MDTGSIWLESNWIAGAKYLTLRIQLDTSDYEEYTDEKDITK